MDALATIVFVILATALLTVSKERAPIPLLIGCSYISMGQGIEVGPISLQFYRLILLVGVLRAILRGESLKGGITRVDKLVISLCVWNLFASLFHEHTPGSGPIWAIGVMLNLLATYFLLRSWCDSMEGLLRIVKALAIILLPLALEMLYERQNGRNLFSYITEVPFYSSVRDGEFRARGPFRHPILAGTVGATCLPLMAAIWNSNRIISIIGIFSCVAIIMACGSSGPFIAAAVCLVILVGWKFRKHFYRLFWLAIFSYIGFDLVTGQPAYFYVTKLNFTGNSTAYYRARIIDTTIEHFSEWFLFGTDKTSHWIPRGIGSVMGDHMDITNYFIAWGVNAGIVGVMLLVFIFFFAMKHVVDIVINSKTITNIQTRITIWCTGATLMGHCASGMSVAYFDQSKVFLWLSIAIAASAHNFLDEKPEHTHEEGSYTT